MSKHIERIYYRIDRTWFISNENRLRLIVQAAVEYVIETNFQ